MFRVVLWDILPCKIIVDRRFRGAYCDVDVRVDTNVSETHTVTIFRIAGLQG
jgi:hypothetical protein